MAAPETRHSSKRFLFRRNFVLALQLIVFIFNVQALIWLFLVPSSGTASGSPHRSFSVLPHSFSGGNDLDAAGNTAENHERGPSRPLEIWARSRAVKSPDDAHLKIMQYLNVTERDELEALCGRTLYHGLQNVVVSRNIGTWTFFATGDLPLMWIRDSAFQIGVLLPRLIDRPALRPIVDGALRAQAFYILQDPYANGYYPDWRDPFKHNDYDRKNGRGGWVGVRNYELDSGAYFLNLLYNYWGTPGLYAPEEVIKDPMIFQAANTLINTWIVEQNHTASNSPYRFIDLPNDGVGRPVAYTGMIWSGFRPSDDANMYGYSIPSNMYAASALARSLEINRAIWKDVEFERKASKLLKDVESGIKEFGTLKSPDGSTIYAYEVDGFGHQLYDFDDPNWPSLVSMPLLGWELYDDSVYRETRSRLLSKHNKYWYQGKFFEGMGSPHTATGMAWALGTLSEALTARTPQEQADKLRLLLKLQCKDGLMHESIHVNDPYKCTRRWFEWANSLLVTAVEHLTGVDCDRSAERWHREHIARNEITRQGGSVEDISKILQYPADRHQGIEASVQWDVKYESRVEDWKGIGWTI